MESKVPSALPRLAGAAVAVLVLAADQGSKVWIVHGLRLPEIGSVQLLPVLNFTWVENRGITFGLLNGAGNLGPMLLTLLALAVVAALVGWLWRAERVLVAVALGAIIGGALGNNVFDRPRLGYVIDFIHAHAWGWSWYVFNVADAAIVCGVAALVLDGIFVHPSHRDSRDQLADTPDHR